MGWFLEERDTTDAGCDYVTYAGFPEKDSRTSTDGAWSGIDLNCPICDNPDIFRNGFGVWGKMIYSSK